VGGWLARGLLVTTAKPDLGLSVVKRGIVVNKGGGTRVIEESIARARFAE